MAELKTQKTDADVPAFLESIADEKQREDAKTVLALMREITGAEPKLWGTSIVGFGAYRYKYATGREGDWFLAGFSPRKANLTLYLMAGFDRYDDLLANLGKHKIGKGCLYIKRLSDIDLPTLRALIEASVEQLKASSTAPG